MRITRFETLWVAGVLLMGSAGTVAVAPASATEARIEAPAARAQEDPADSLYRVARATLNRSDYLQAAALFERLVRQHPQSAYAADALYWKAFSLYRVGGPSNLRRAAAALQSQARRYAAAATYRNGDAPALAARIEGQLARLGDADAAQRVVEAAQLAAEMDKQMTEVERQAAEVTRQAAEVTRQAVERDQRIRSGRSAGAGHPQPGPCADEQDDVRTAALNALLNMDTDRAVPILKKVLARRDECSGPLRRRALFLLSQKRTSGTEDLLLDVARNDPDPEVRKQAVFWLSQVDSDRAVEVLREILKTSADPELEDRAVFALSQHPDKQAGEILRAYASDTSKPAEIREKAIFWLSQRGETADAAFLRGLYSKLSSEELKERVLFALSQVEDRESAGWLLETAADTGQSLELRKKALFWAAQGGAPLEKLSGLYDRMPDHAMKEQLIFALSQRDEPDAVTRLIEIARTEKDPELRKKVIFWLGQVDDPRAVDFLLEILAREGGRP